MLMLIVGGSIILIFLTADVLANIRYKHCPKCGYDGKEKTFDLP